MIKPQRLMKGDTVGIIAPASPPDQNQLIKSIEFLHELGLHIKFGKHITKRNKYLAGEDEQRLEDLHEMFLDDEVKGIFCARGGYGSARFASFIDYQLIREHPKIFWGYSDITFLHHAIWKKTGLVTFHGPMLASDIGIEDVHPMTKRFFYQLFHPVTIVYTEDISPLETIVEGEGEGILVGGNLSLLVSTLGTPFEIDTKGKILVLEDINERPQSVDRMLNHLLMAGKLTEAEGILIGDFYGEELSQINEVINDYLLKANRPAMKGFQFGHCSPNISIPLGVKAILNTKAKIVSIENGVL